MRLYIRDGKTVCRSWGITLNYYSSVLVIHAKTGNCFTEQAWTSARCGQTSTSYKSHEILVLSFNLDLEDIRLVPKLLHTYF